MAHYAFIDKNNVVVEVIVGRNEDEIVDGISDWEEHYAQFRDGLICKRTSYNTFENQHTKGGIPFRGNFACIGGIYVPNLDIFMPPQRYASWTINAQTCAWLPPVPKPEHVPGMFRIWNENEQKWEYVPQSTVE